MCSEFREKERKNINHLGELPWKQMLFFSSTLSIASLAASCGKTYIESSYESGICTKSPRVLYWSSMKASSISLCQNESSFDVTSPSTTKLTGSKTTTQLTKLPMFLGDLLQPKQLSCINKQIIDKIAVFLSIFFRPDSFPWTHMTIKEDNDISCGSITSCVPLMAPSFWHCWTLKQTKTKGQWVYWYRTTPEIRCLEDIPFLFWGFG